MADRDNGGGVRSPLIRFDATAAPRRRCFCFPFAGGGPTTYRHWPASLPGDVEVVVVMAAGRDPRSRAPNERPPGSMAGIVAPALEAIAELHTTSPLPFSMFGHSMGALVAYEVTVALERRFEESAGTISGPDHLFVSGRRPADELHEGRRIHALPDDDFIDAMQRDYGGIPDLVRNEPDLLALFMPGLRADVEVFETYAPLTDRRVTCPVTVYGGDDDRGPRPELLSGWQRLAERTISVRTFPGGHFYLNDERRELCADISVRWDTAAVGSTRDRRLPKMS